MKIDLLKFCSKDESRPEIMLPFDRGEWTCATDGRILIRVDRIEGIEKAAGPKLEAQLATIITASGSDASRAEPPPVPEGYWRKQCCEECYINEEISPHCDDCEGTGVVESWHGCPVAFHGIELGGSFIKLIIDELPNARIFPISGASLGLGGTGESVGIIFDGGRGVLMSMKKGSIAKWKDEHAS